ncbi:hypothetical protein OY671_007999, partial [Metschnikowia pulcherrima]
MERIKARYRKLVFFTWFSTSDSIMFGAFVRSTDSGSGCPDWPGCYGSVTPSGAMGDIHEASQAMPFGPVTSSKAWIEMIHRYVGSILGMSIIGIVYMAWRYRRESGRSPASAVTTSVAVCVQGAFGAWTVTHKSMPAVVTAHSVFGSSVSASMTWSSARERPHHAVAAAARRFKPWVIGGFASSLIQVTSGGWVSTNYAASACMDFPMCHGKWVPDMDFHGGYSIIRGSGESPSGEMISQPASTAIHWVHRNFAFVVFAYSGVSAWRSRADRGSRGPATSMSASSGAQLSTGSTTIFFQWPLLIAVSHNGGAAGSTSAAVVS